jgi:cbb3-type cytochrome oxidase subunit 3
LKRVLTILLGVTFSLYCFGQTSHSYQYTIDDFLPENSVRSIFKDSKNNLWVGTDNGLLKITGTNKQLYTNEDGLASNKVWSIEEDKNGVVWFGCFTGGICRWNGDSIKVFATEKELGDNKIRKLYYSKKHDLMFVGGNYTFSRIKNDSIKYFRYYFTKPHVIVTNFLKNDTVVFVLTYGKHAWRYYPEKDTATLFSIFDKGKNKNRWYYSTSSMVLNNKDTLVSFHDNGINIFTKNGMIPYRGFGQVFDLYEEKDRLWMAAWNAGVAHVSKIGKAGGLYTLENGQIINQSDKFGIETEQCWDLWKDTINKQLYLATNNKGLYVIDDPIFTNYGADYFKEKELHTTQIFVVDSSIFFNGHNNLIKWTNDTYEKISAKKIHNIIKKAKPNYYSKSGFKDELESKAVNELFEIDSQGRYIYFNNKMGLYRSPLNNWTDLKYFFNPRGRSVKFNNRKLLSNTNSHLIIYDTVTWEKDKVIKMSKANMYGREGTFLKLDSLFYAAKGKNGFYEIYNDSAYEITIPDSLTSVNVNSFITNDGKVFYCAMRDGKILKAVKTDTTWNWSNIKLPCNCGNSIWWLLKKDDYIYFSSNTGIGCFRYINDEVQDFKFLTKNQGYHGQDSREATFGANGNIFIPAIDRIIEVNTERLKKYNHHLGELVLNKIELEHKDAENEIIQLNRKDELSLPYYKNTFNLFYNITQPQISEDVKYQFILEGYQKYWSKPSKNNEAFFNRVPSGKYTFRVKAYTASQPSQIIELNFPITILMPFYQTWWFFTSIFVVLIGLIAFIFKRQRRKEFDKWQTSLRIKELEKQSLLSKINPHFLFNSLNSVQKFILNHQNEEAIGFIGKFSKLIRQSLENSVDETVELSKEIDLLENYMHFEQKRCEIPFNYHINIDENIDTKEIYIPPMLIQPFIENSIKHGVDHLNRQGNITLEVKIQNDKALLINVIDDGIGRAESGKKRNDNSKSSLGIKLVKDRIHLYNDIKWKEPIYKVEYEDLCIDNKSLGTKVSLFIPIFTF